MSVSVSLFERAADNSPEAVELPAGEFLSSFAEEPELVEGVTLENAKAIKNAGKCWAGTFKGTRSKANFVSIPAIVYDLDGMDGAKDGVDLAAVLVLLEDMNVSYAVHSTFSSGFVRPYHKLRVVLPTSRPVNAEEYVALWDKYAEAFHADAATRNAERIHFAPRIPIEHKDHYFCKVVSDRPYLQPPARRGVDLNAPTNGRSRDWLVELATTTTKDDTLHRAAFRLGKEAAMAGQDEATALAEVWAKCEAALKANPSPVDDWEHAIDNCRRNSTAGFKVGLEEMADPLPPAAEKTPDEKAHARAAKTLEKFRKQLKSAPNLKQLNRLAFFMGEHVANGAIETETVRAVLLKAAPGLDQADAQSTIETALASGAKKTTVNKEWMRDLTMDENGRFPASDKNVATVLKTHPECVNLLFTDTRTDTYKMRHMPPWDCEDSEFPCVLDVDGGAVAVMNWLSATLGSDVSLRMTKEALVHVAAETAEDPFRDYLEGLKWDDVERLSGWLVNAAGAEDSRYTRAVGRRWLIGAVARTMNPGCKMDNMLLLTGVQGAGKSTTFAALVPEETWFTDSLPGMDDKDSAIALYKAVVVEMAELAHMRKHDAERVKHFISSAGATVRPAYARVAKYFPRRGVLGGTTNAHSDFLEDPTGARRFWIVAATVCSPEWVRIHRDQLWAEALAAHRSGEQHWLTPEEEALAREKQEMATRQDPLAVLLEGYAVEGIPSEYIGKNKFEPEGVFIEPLDNQMLPGNKPAFLTVEQVCTLLGLDLAKHSRYAATLLHAAGFAKGARERVDGRRIQPYRR